MFQTDQSTASSTLPTPATAGTQGFFTNGNPATGVAATIVDADWLNMIQEELVNIVIAAGLTPSKTTYNQVLQAILAIGKQSNLLIDTGAANAYAAVNGIPLTATTLVHGVRQRVQFAHANTGASTYAPDGLPPQPIYGLAVQALQGAEIAANGIGDLIYFVNAAVNSGNGAWIMLQCTGGALQIAPATASGHAVQLGQVPTAAVGPTTAINANTTLTAAQSGAFFEISAGTAMLPAAADKLNFTFCGTGTSTGSIASPAGVQLVLPDGTSTAAGTLAVGLFSVVQVRCDGSSWIVTNTSGQVITKPATQSNQAVQLGQMNAAVVGKNRLINGTMAIDQRNSGVAQTFTAGAAIAYCVDRWYAACTGANVTGQRSGTFGGYTLTGAASNTGTTFGQRIESYNVWDLVNSNVTQHVTLSSISLTSITWNAYYASTQDNFSTKTLIASGNIAINTVPTVYSFTFNPGPNAANGIAIEFVSGPLLAGQTLSYNLAQLEAGSIATTFERRLIGTELSLAQRYYESLSIGLLLSAQYNAGATLRGTVFWKVSKRVAPTVTVTAGVIEAITTEKIQVSLANNPSDLNIGSVTANSEL